MSEENRLMSKAEIRAWIDTEGFIYSTPPPLSLARLTVTQEYREPLETLCESMKRHGVPCTIYKVPPKHHRVEIKGFEEVAKAIKEFGPFRNPLRRQQVQRFIDHLRIRPKRERPERRRARQILGI
jgi:hypothetical protein